MSNFQNSIEGILNLVQESNYPMTQEIVDEMETLKAEGRRIVNGMSEDGTLMDTLNQSETRLNGDGETIPNTQLYAIMSPKDHGDTIQVRSGVARRGAKPFTYVLIRNAKGRHIYYPISALKRRSYTERFQRFMDKYEKELTQNT